MDLFRWKRTILRALAPALVCAVLAGWGVYVLTANERPTYRSFALLNTGIMSNRDIGGAYNRDLVINELENIMNLARSFETREELSARLLARFLALDGPDAQIISPRAYKDLEAVLDAKIKSRHGRHRDQELIYRSIVQERDSLRRYGEAMRFHPLLELLYGENELIGTEHLAGLKVNRKGMSDLLEISYSTVDAAWAKATLDLHIDIFLKAHKEIKDQKRGGALSYFQEATDKSRKTLDDAEERLRLFSTQNKIINYYEQTRYIASLKNQVDNRYTEEKMVQAAADSTLRVLEDKLKKRTNLIRLNNLIDDKRRELGQLSKEQVRLEIMTLDTTENSTGKLDLVQSKMKQLRASITDEVTNLQLVHGGPEGLELGRLITEWLAAVLSVEEASGRLEVLDARKKDFNTVYTRMADLGATIKKIEREVHIAEEDYLENLSNLNDALQKEFSSGSNTELRLVDAPVLISKPEKSQRTILVGVGFILGGSFPLILAIALELLSNAILSFAEAERRSTLHVIGGVSRWSRLQRLVRGRYAVSLHTTTADLLWQGLQSRSKNKVKGETRLIAVASFRPAVGKSYVMNLLANRLSSRGLKVCVVTEKINPEKPTYASYTSVVITGTDALVPGVSARSVCGLSSEQWNYFDVIFWELPAVATGRMPVEIARQADEAILIHPASAGWNSSLDPFLSQLKDTLGSNPFLVVNGFAVDVLLNEWGASLKQLRSWSDTEGKTSNSNDDAQVDNPIIFSSDRRKDVKDGEIGRRVDFNDLPAFNYEEEPDAAASLLPEIKQDKGKEWTYPPREKSEFALDKSPVTPVQKPPIPTPQANVYHNNRPDESPNIQEVFPAPGEKPHIPTPQEDVYQHRRPDESPNIQKVFPAPGEKPHIPTPHEDIYQHRRPDESPEIQKVFPAPGEKPHIPTPQEDIYQHRRPDESPEIQEVFSAPGEKPHIPAPQEDIYQHRSPDESPEIQKEFSAPVEAYKKTAAPDDSWEAELSANEASPEAFSAGKAEAEQQEENESEQQVGFNAWEEALIQPSGSSPKNIWELPQEPTTPPPFPKPISEKINKITEDWESNLLDS